MSQSEEDDRRSAERAGANRRGLARRRCLIGGLLVRPGSDYVDRVGVRNLSASGAKLVMEGLGVVHPGTVLVIPKIEAAFEIEVVWRELPESGVRFTRIQALDADPRLQAAMRSAA